MDKETNWDKLLDGQDVRPTRKAAYIAWASTPADSYITNETLVTFQKMMFASFGYLPVIWLFIFVDLLLA